MLLCYSAQAWHKYLLCKLAVTLGKVLTPLNLIFLLSRIGTGILCSSRRPCTLELTVCILQATAGVGVGGQKGQGCQARKRVGTEHRAPVPVSGTCHGPGPGGCPWQTTEAHRDLASALPPLGLPIHLWGLGHWLPSGFAVASSACIALPSQHPSCERPECGAW